MNVARGLEHLVLPASAAGGQVVRGRHGTRESCTAVVEAAAVHSAGGPSHKSSAVGRFGAWETRPWPCQLPFRVEHLNIPHLKWTRHRCRRDHPEHGNPGVKLNHFPFSRPILVPSWSVLHRQWLNRGHPVGFFVTCNESWTKVGATWQRPVGGRDKDSRHDKKVQQRRCPVTATEPSEQDRQHGDTKTWATAAAAENREKHLRAVRHVVCVLHREREGRMLAALSEESC